MDAYIKNQNAFTNVTEWHEHGITGKGVLVWDMEGLTEHGKYTRQRILDAAPDAEVINRPWNISCSSKELHSEYVYDENTKSNLPFEEFVKKYKPQVCSCSKGGGSENRWQWSRPIIRKVKKDIPLLMFNSAGNDGSDGVKGGSLPPEEAMYIGAVMMFQNNPEDIRGCGYSSLGDEFEEVDFSSFVGKQGYSGTSFSTPFVAGQAALLLQRYGKMSYQEMYNYFKMCSKPLMLDHNAIKIDFVGGRYIYDFRTGYGIPVLPAFDKNYVTMDIGSRIYMKNGIPLEMDTEPFIKDSRTFVPIAFVALALGAEVEWNALLKQVRITKGDKRVELYINKKYYYVNGKRYELDTAPFIKDSRTFVPVSHVALALGARVAWAADERRVQILEV